MLPGSPIVRKVLDCGDGALAQSPLWFPSDRRLLNMGKKEQSVPDLDYCFELTHFRAGRYLFDDDP